MRPVFSRSRTALSLTALCGLLSSSASAQTDLFVTSNRTIIGGNPINGSYKSVRVGYDSSFASVPNVLADITGGSADFVGAYNSSLVNVTGGTFGITSSGPTIYQGLGVGSGATLNLLSGTFRSFGQIGTYSPTSVLSTFNMSGGSITSIYNNYGGVVRVSGGTITGDSGLLGAVTNAGDGRIEMTGGSAGIVGNVSYESGAITNFGGSATANQIRGNNGTVNVTGGSYGGVSLFGPGGTVNLRGGNLGSGGVNIVGQLGQVNFYGSNITATTTGTGSYFDDNYYQNYITSTYTVAGRLTDGTAFATTLSGGSMYTNTDSLASFNGPTVAPDLYIETDQSVAGTYNFINVGIDESYSTPSSPTATIADGTDAVYLATYGGSVTNIVGGLLRGDIYAGDQSRVSIRGGEIDGGIYADADSAVTMSGGLYLGYGVYLSGNGSFTLQGTDVVASGATGQYYDPNYDTNYLSAGNFHVSANFADGNSFDYDIIAGGASGDSTRQTLIAPTAAPNLYITQNRNVATIQNQVRIGEGEDGSQASPTVGFVQGANTGTVFLSNRSVLNIQDGVVNGTLYSGRDAQLNISGGTVNRIFQSYTGVPTDGVITVSGGSVNYVAPANRMLVTGGQITTLDTYAGAMVRITGGNINQILAYGGSGARGDISIFGGSVSSIVGYGGAVNIFGGIVGAGNLYNFSSGLFTLYGSGFSIVNPTAGTYQGSSGVWWDVAGNLSGGQSISTRYFEANGSLSGPAYLRSSAAAPEPGTLALMTLPLIVLLARRRVRGQVTG